MDIQETGIREIVDHKKICSSCHNNVDNRKYISKRTGKELKTCERCRDKSKRQVRTKELNAEYSRRFRRKHPKYDKRTKSRAEYMRRYRAQRRANTDRPVTDRPTAPAPTDQHHGVNTPR